MKVSTISILVINAIVKAYTTALGKLPRLP
jgi:hypothetical protein